MTQVQLDDKIDETKMYIADKFRDITMQADALKTKTPEDEEKVKQILTKISDFIEEIYRGYGTLEGLSREDVEEEPSDVGDNFFGC